MEAKGHQDYLVRDEVDLSDLGLTSISDPARFSLCRRIDLSGNGLRSLSTTTLTFWRSCETLVVDEGVLTEEDAKDIMPRLKELVIKN